MGRTAPTPPRPFKLDFGPMRKRRRMSDLTAKDLALSAGVNESTIFRTENNVTMPTVAQLVAIARALGAPMTTLFEVVEVRE